MYQKHPIYIIMQFFNYILVELLTLLILKLEFFFFSLTFLKFKSKNVKIG